MIEVRTDTGVSLDLAPDTDFEVELNNPLLESDRVPVAFSTSITFPVSDINREVFGYLPAMLLPPSVTRVPVTILFGGIPIFTGTLVYDSLDENGNLIYTFTEKAFDDCLEKKIHELDLPKSVQPGGWSPGQLVNRIRNGQEEGIGAPVLYDPNGAVTKYHNLPFSDNYSRFTPCVSLSKLLSFAPHLNLEASQLTALLENVYILGLHKPFTGQLEGYGENLSIADTLPDVTLLDILTEVCKMTCSSLFADGGSYTIVPFSAIGTDLVDWDNKLSDKYTFSIEKATGYKFGYQHDEQNNCEEFNEIIDVNNFIDILAPTQLTAGEFARHDHTKDIYTSRMSSMNLDDHHTAKLCILFHFENIDSETRINGDEFDNTLSANLIQNVPHVFAREAADGQNGSQFLERYYRLAGQVSFPKDGDDRKSTIILGVFEDGQLVGKGIRMSENISDVQTSYDLSAESLYNSYHKKFAAWLAKDRQVIQADLDLSLSDISSFRMWHAVMVRNRLFIVKRLTLHLSMGLDHPLSSVELMSL